MPTWEQRLADMFVELAGGAARDGPFDAAGLLSLLAAHSAGLHGVREAGAVLVPGGGAEETAYVEASTTAARQLEWDALGWEEGPGHDCRRSGVPMAEEVLGGAAAARRWPRYSRRAREDGFTSAAALPLRGHGGHLDGGAIGALVLLGFSRGPLPADTLALGQSFADVAAIALLRDREMRESRVRAAQLEHALTSRVVIEQAKGVLAARTELPVDEVFAVLRGYARAHQRPLIDVARDVVEGRADLGGAESF